MTNTTVTPQNLDDIVLELAIAIQGYPETSDRDEVMQLASELNSQLGYGQKRGFKDKLIELLGYENADYKVTGSLQTIPENIIYLSDLGVDDVGKVVTRFPTVLGCSIDNMNLVVEYLKSIGVREEDIGNVVTGLPSILGSDIEKNLKPTYEFLQEYFDVDVEDIIATPALLSYSLEKRIKPRYEFLKLKDLEETYAATRVLFPSDKNFCKLLKCPVREYLEFKKEYFAAAGTRAA